MKKIYFLFCFVLAFAGAVKSQSLNLTASPNSGCAPLPVTLNFSQAGAASYDIHISYFGFNLDTFGITSNTFSAVAPYGGSWYVNAVSHDNAGNNIGFASQTILV